jgi:hypothetical protein
MVRIADVVDIKPSITGKKRKIQLAKIAQKHFDFVLVDDSMKVLCAIELNDSSHDRQDRIERDKFVREVMRLAKVPLIEIKAARKYNHSMIRKLLVDCVPNLWSLDEVSFKKNEQQVVEVSMPVPVPCIEEEQTYANSLFEPGIKSLSEIQSEYGGENVGVSPFDRALQKSQAYLEQEEKDHSEQASSEALAKGENA